MKVTEKIVTSVTQPQQTNVMWHNPDTGEFKIFGGKGWENAGGNPGQAGSSFSGGYPVVTVENDFNIEAQPNTFYNIKNSPDNEVNINFKDKEFGGEGGKILVFYTDIERLTNELGDERVQMLILLTGIGCTIVPNSEHEGFKYEVFLNPLVLEIFNLSEMRIFISDIPTSDLQDTSSSVNMLILGDKPDDVFTQRIPFIYTINKDIDYIAWYDMPIAGIGSVQFPVIFTQETGYDGEQYSYQGFIAQDVCLVPCTLYTQVEYTKAEKVDTVVVELPNGSTDEVAELPITVQANKELTMSDEVKEFVFNLKSPANIVLSHPVSWNNDNTPDFTKSGTYTLSILNGVGCYTFI